MSNFYGLRYEIYDPNFNGAYLQKIYSAFAKINLSFSAYSMTAVSPVSYYSDVGLQRTSPLMSVEHFSSATMRIPLQTPFKATDQKAHSFVRLSWVGAVRGNR